ncbi:MAG TPA: hypothetical protein VFF69_08300 [Phycisphaerales bacterium]|nr:hypothetical protein [Phycisphaerales bacterium]
MPAPPLKPMQPASWRRQRVDWSERLRSPKARDIGLALCDAMVGWDGGKGPPPSLDLMTAALDSGAMWVSHSAAHELGLVLPLHGEPFDLATGIWRSVRALGRSRMAWEAGRICAAMTREQAVAFRTLGLRDRSKLVRGDATYVAAKSGLPELLPVLLGLSRNEPEPSIRRHAEISSHLLDRGYLIEPSAFDGSAWDITVLCEETHPGEGKSRLSTMIKRSVVERLGPDRVAAELRRHAADFSPCSWEVDGVDMTNPNK